ncbi:hypothetical protein PG994_011578 [Apiospora phragmitis]|uniref:Uncharacterized protein n=1 Tax=Apiospora phragmitis TaxID=2905665 RepID=A0ABR1TVR6_9PEZI
MSMKQICPGTYIVRVHPSHKGLFECIWRAYESSFNTDRSTPPPTNANKHDEIVKAMVIMGLPHPRDVALAIREDLPLVIPPPPLPDRAPYPFLTPPPVAQKARQPDPSGPSFAPAYQGGNDHPASQCPLVLPDLAHADSTQSLPANPSDESSNY